MYKGQNCSGALTPEPPPGLRHDPAAELTAPSNPHLHFATISWSFHMKQNIRKLNL